jgi:hypothetical protein
MAQLVASLGSRALDSMGRMRLETRILLAEIETQDEETEMT